MKGGSLGDLPAHASMELCWPTRARPLPIRRYFCTSRVGGGGAERSGVDTCTLSPSSERAGCQGQPEAATAGGGGKENRNALRKVGANTWARWGRALGPERRTCWLAPRAPPALHPERPARQYLGLGLEGEREWRAPGSSGCGAWLRAHHGRAAEEPAGFAARCSLPAPLRALPGTGGRPRRELRGPRGGRGASAGARASPRGQRQGRRGAGQWAAESRGPAGNSGPGDHKGRGRGQLAPQPADLLVQATPRPGDGRALTLPSREGRIPGGDLVPRAVCSWEGGCGVQSPG